ncbi:MAG TPA: hypothetical protein VFE47_23985 [Tepidisphaeraceae bacterium]|nr:hypothetical protein [Tepidisphaeraceae bacterium]
MSEYQYYEFRAIDRPLTRKQMDEVGRYSTRAEITATSFINEYHWGDFRGDEIQFIEKYFDAMVYFANWGTHRFLFRVPAEFVDRKILKAYCGHSVEMIARGDNLILDLTSDPEDGGDDYYETDWMADLLAIRAEVFAGDLRPLYIGWLAGLWDYDDGKLEPPVPAGMKNLTDSQAELAEFLRVDSDVLGVAAATSADRQPPGREGDFNAWLVARPAAQKDEALIALAANADPLLPARLYRQFQAQQATPPEAKASRRTVGQLREQAEQVTIKREAREAALAAKKRAKREAEEARQREAHLDQLAKRGDLPWKDIENLVQTKQPANYEAAVKLLKDLRDISLREGSTSQFALRVHSLIDRHVRKSTFHKRVLKANVIPQSPGVA